MAPTSKFSSFHASLDTPLLSFGGEVWRIRDAAEAMCIVGAPGSGKSSGSGKAVAKACLAAGMGALILCAKTDEAATWRRYVQEAGREADLVVIDASGKERFNILDFAARRLGGPGFEQNLVEVMRRMAEAARIADDKNTTSSGGDNAFFVDAAMKWISHAFPLLLVVEGTLRLNDLDRFITTCPKSPSDLHSAAWREGYCGQVHRRVHELAKADAYANRIMNEHGGFFLSEVAHLDNRPRSGIEASLTNLIYPFLAGKLAELFCTTTTITPDACRYGAIILMDLPTQRYGITGAVAQSLFKYLFGVAAQSMPATDNTRPVLLYADEAQNFLSSSDADLLAMARSARICTVMITQDYPTFAAKLGKEVAESLWGKFGTRVFHANTSRETNIAAAELIGKAQKFHVGETQGTTTNAGGSATNQDSRGVGGDGFQGQTSRSTSKSQSSSGYLDYEIPPDYFAYKLRTGSKQNNFKVDGIVIRNGRVWKRTK